MEQRRCANVRKKSHLNFTPYLPPPPPPPPHTHFYVTLEPQAKCKEIGVDFKMCARCKSVSYCSRECQKSDWKVHKTVCKDIKRLGLAMKTMKIDPTEGWFKAVTIKNICAMKSIITEFGTGIVNKRTATIRKGYKMNALHMAVRTYMYI